MNLRTLLGGWFGSNGPQPGAAAPARDPEADRAEGERLHALGLRHYQAGELQEATRHLECAIELKPDDAAAHHHLGLVYSMLGRTDDAVDCFSLACHFAPSMAQAHLDLGTALHAQGRRQEAETACRRACELAPELAEASFALARLVKERGDLEQAAACYRQAVSFRPDFAEACCNLGLVLHDLGRFDEAQHVLARALELNADFAEAHHNLGLTLLETGEAQRALRHFRRAAELKPESIATQACIGHALRDLGELDQAIACYDEALSRQPDFGDAVINRSHTHLAMGDYGAGWAGYEKRFAATGTSARHFPFPPWRGEPLTGKTLLVYAEQGLGDEIMFASCLPDALERAGRCVIECSARLEKLFRRSFGSALVHGGSKTDGIEWLSGVPRADYQVRIGSLPLFFRTQRAAFPSRRGYLRADPDRVGHWRGLLQAQHGTLKIGISWRGGSHRTRGLLRSLPLERLAGCLAGHGACLVSLQYGECGDDIARARAATGANILDWSGQLSDLDEAAALIDALDLVVSVDNTVVHMAGALGKPVWALLSSSPEWRYLRLGDTMPWYPSARLFRQPAPGDWGGVLHALSAALTSFEREHRAV